MELAPYTDGDRWLTEALETDPAVMRELGGPVAREDLLDTHRRRVADAWWFKIVLDDPGRSAVGAIGVWATQHGADVLHETGWMVLPAHQGRGIASAALRLLIARVRAEPGFASIHAFPTVANSPSNALCRRAGFTLVGTDEFVFRGRALTCNHWSLATPGP